MWTILCCDSCCNDLKYYFVSCESWWRRLLCFGCRRPLHQESWWIWNMLFNEMFLLQLSIFSYRWDFGTRQSGNQDVIKMSSPVIDPNGQIIDLKKNNWKENAIEWGIPVEYVIGVSTGWVGERNSVWFVEVAFGGRPSPQQVVTAVPTLVGFFIQPVHFLASK